MLDDKEQRVRLAVLFALGHIGGPQARDALQSVVELGDEVEAFAAEQALEEMDFYAGAQAAAVPLFDEAEAEDDDEVWREPGDWDAGGDDDDNLGEYE
jgi:HEAT repeat protein